MKVIPASYEILEDLDKQSLVTRIEVCGRLCYKSEDKITAQSAAPFVKNIIKRGHNSVTEMGVFSLRIHVSDGKQVSEIYGVLPKYLFIDEVDDTLLITGSVRAFRELILKHSEIRLVNAIGKFLIDRHPILYDDIAMKTVTGNNGPGQIEKVPLAEIDKLPTVLLAKHRHIAVKFYVNRAITHEIVRHRPCSYLQESQRYCRYSESKFDNQVTFIKPMFFKEGSEEYELWEKAMLDTEKIYIKLLETSSPQAARTVLPNSCKTELIAYANLVEWHHIFNLRTSAGAEPSMREIMNPLLAEFRKRFLPIFDDIRPAA